MNAYQNLNFIPNLGKMKINFRRARRDDISKIVEMLADDDLGSKREKFEEPLPKTYVSAFENINSDKNQELIIAENEDLEIVGTLQLSFIQYLTYQGGTRAQIEAVRIRKDKRGTGLGKIMFKWAIERTKDKKAHLLQLTTDKQRPDAIAFYKDLGFIQSHEGMKMHFD